MQLTYVDHMGSDLSVVNAARVSFGKHHKEFDVLGDTKLIDYLASHDHHSPFNHTFLTCHVKAPIFVARQLVKHEYMPWNEISRRYVDSEPEFYWPPNLEWSGRASDKKQGSEGKVVLPYDMINPMEDVEPSDYEDYILNTYNYMLSQGVAPEQARMILPLNTYTEWYWSGTFGAWMKMYNLRIKEDTQEETGEIARQAGEVLKAHFPVSFDACRKDV